MTTPTSTATPHVSAAKYLWIWVWLACLMLLGVALSEFPILPLPAQTIMLIVLGLSTVKALLVALYYMHLKFDGPVVVIMAVFPLVIILLAVLLVWSAQLVRL